MVSSLSRRLTFAIATTLALLLTFLPTSVAAIKAAIQQQSTNTNSEETHEELVHKAKEDRETRTERILHAPGPDVPSISIVLAPRESAPLRSVATPLHPSQYSVRRLL